MINKIDWATFGSSGVMRFGDKKIMFGKATIPNVPNGQDKTVDITFPESFENTPRIVATCTNWLAIRAVFATDITVSSAKLGAHHIQGSTQNVPLDWIAIG